MVLHRPTREGSWAIRAFALNRLKGQVAPVWAPGASPPTPAPHQGKGDLDCLRLPSSRRIRFHGGR